VLLPLLFMGALLFPKYSFMQADVVPSGVRLAAAGRERGRCGGHVRLSDCNDGSKVPRNGVDCGGRVQGVRQHTPPPCAVTLARPNETGVDCGGLCPVCGPAGCGTGR